MKHTLYALIAVSSIGLIQPAHAQKTEFWMSNGATSVASFMAHKDKIDIISPTWYQIDQNGFVSGEPQPVVLKAAKEAHLTLIPLFALFNPDKAHALFNDPKAQDALIASLLRECKENGYDGTNLDIENVLWTDRDSLSALVKKIADALHKEHLQVQIDVVPNAPGHAGETPFSAWIFQEWRGAYDLKALSDSVDLICLMTYDQNTRWTTPGPVDGWVWTIRTSTTHSNLYPKASSPSASRSMVITGIPVSPGYDGKDRTPHPTADYISYADTIYLRDTYGGKTQWDNEEHTPWFFINRDQMREWFFYTDKRAFMDRFDLAAKSNVQGVCAWVLGEEDPAIWDAIPAKR